MSLFLTARRIVGFIYFNPVFKSRKKQQGLKLWYCGTDRMHGRDYCPKGVEERKVMLNSAC